MNMSNENCHVKKKQTKVLYFSWMWQQTKLWCKVASTTENKHKSNN